MKITEVRTCKQINSTVDHDYDSIKAATNESDKMLRDEEFNADEVTECCARIEELAKAIAGGVINR